MKNKLLRRQNFSPIRPQASASPPTGAGGDVCDEHDNLCEDERGNSESGEDEVDMALIRPAMGSTECFDMADVSIQRGYEKGRLKPTKMLQHNSNTHHRHGRHTFNPTKPTKASKNQWGRNKSPHNHAKNIRSPKSNHQETYIYSKQTVPLTKVGLNRQNENVNDTSNQSSEPEEKVTVVDILGNLIGIGSYLFDVGSDLWVAYTYFMAGHWWWFGLTLSFVIVPSLTMTLFSFDWYMTDRKHHAPSPLRWISRVVFLFFQIAPVLRYIDAMIYAVRSWKAVSHVEIHKHWYHRMLNEDTDSTLLRLFECFLEAAPQLVLQLYVISTIGLQSTWYMEIVQAHSIVMTVFVCETGAAQCISCLTSLFSLTWGLAAYHKALRYSTDKANMTWPGFLLQLVWRLFTVASRVLAIALFASQVHGWIFAVAVSIHCFLMWVWLIIMGTDFCGKNKVKETLFDLVLAVVYIFEYLNPVEGHTRLRYLIFYSTIYIENCAMITVWYTFKSTENAWYIHPSLSLVFLGFFIGIFCQIIYYKFFHPNNYPNNHQPIQTCLPWEKWLNRKSDENKDAEKPNRNSQLALDSETKNSTQEDKSQPGTQTSDTCSLDITPITDQSSIFSDPGDNLNDVMRSNQRIDEGHLLGGQDLHCKTSGDADQEQKVNNLDPEDIPPSEVRYAQIDEPGNQIFTGHNELQHHSDAKPKMLVKKPPNIPKDIRTAKALTYPSARTKPPVCCTPPIPASRTSEFVRKQGTADVPNDIPTRQHRPVPKTVHTNNGRGNSGHRRTALPPSNGSVARRDKKNPSNRPKSQPAFISNVSSHPLRHTSSLPQHSCYPRDETSKALSRNRNHTKNGGNIPIGSSKVSREMGDHNASYGRPMSHPIFTPEMVLAGQPTRTRASVLPVVNSSPANGSTLRALNLESYV